VPPEVMVRVMEGLDVSFGRMTKVEEKEAEAVETKDLTIKQVNFNGDNLLAVKDNITGKVHVAVYYVCKGLKLDENQTKVQRDKINSDLVLSKGGRKISIPTNGGIQDVLCIELEFLPLWLAKINANIISNQESQDKLIEYQLKAKDVLAKAFIGQIQNQKLPSSYAEALRELADKVEENQQLKSENEQMKPDADFGKAIKNNDGLILVRDYVKVLANAGIKIKQRELFKFLSPKYLYRNSYEDYIPRIEYVEQGLFKVIETPVETKTHGSFLSYTTKITGKGQQYFLNKIKEELPCQLQ
jgi:phage antirepressor YoqD-like protein